MREEKRTNPARSAGIPLVYIYRTVCIEKLGKLIIWWIKLFLLAILSNFSWNYVKKKKVINDFPKSFVLPLVSYSLGPYIDPINRALTSSRYLLWLLIFRFWCTMANPALILQCIMYVHSFVLFHWFYVLVSLLRLNVRTKSFFLSWFPFKL